jgi:hypothetical protein
LSAFLPEDSPIKDLIGSYATVKDTMQAAANLGLEVPAELAKELANSGVGLYGEAGTWYGPGPAQTGEALGGVGSIGAGVVAGAFAGYDEYMQTGDIAGAAARGVVSGGIVWGATAAFGPIGGLVAGAVLNAMEGDTDPYATLNYEDAPQFNFEYRPNAGEWVSENGKYPDSFSSAMKDGLNLAQKFGDSALEGLGLDNPDVPFSINSVGTTIALFGTDKGDRSAGDNPYLFATQTKETNQFNDSTFTNPSQNQLFSTINQLPYEMVYEAASKSPEYREAIAAYEMELTGYATRGYGTASAASQQYDTSLQAGEANLREAAANDGQRDLKGLVDYLNNWSGDTTAWDTRNQEIEDRYSSGIDVIQGEYQPNQANPDWSQQNEQAQMEGAYKIPEGYDSEMMINYYRRQAATDMGVYDDYFNDRGYYIGPEDWLL